MMESRISFYWKDFCPQFPVVLVELRISKMFLSQQKSRDERW